MKYRAEIDGLRGLAVVPVILFHAGFELFSGGFVGVDVFFVISGYLITTILIEDIENNRFSIINFYERRVRRILPALFFVMLVCIPFAWMWMLPSQMKGFSQSLVAVSLFASNILFWRESGYFDAAAEEKPLLHTWSLAVEEQYYVLFPIFLILAWRFGKNRVFWMIVVFAAISLALSEWSWWWGGEGNKAIANFYLAPTRAWELFAGSIAAFVVQKRGVQANNALSLLGLAAIVFAIFAYDESTSFPSVDVLVPVVGVVLLVLYADKETLAARLLSTKGCVGIGLISYSAYLWHQPLFVFARIRSLSEPSLFLFFVLIVMSIGLAWCSWKYVEKPFRNREQISRSSIFLLSTFGFVAFLFFGMQGHLNGGYKNRISESLSAQLDAAVERYPHFESCYLEASTLSHPIAECADYFVDGRASVMLIGDSHLEAIGDALQQRFMDLGIGSYSVPYVGCVAIQGLYRIDKNSSHQCNEHNRSMIQYARESRIETIILISRFPLYLNGDPYDNGEGGVESGTPMYVDIIERRGQTARWDDIDRQDRVARRYAEELKTLSEEFNLIVFEPVPEVGWHVVNRKFRMFYISDEQITHSLEGYEHRTQRFNSILDNLSQDNVYRFSVADILCDNETDRCSTSDANGLYYRDGNHLSIYGASLAADKFFENLPLPLRRFAQ